MGMIFKNKEKQIAKVVSLDVNLIVPNRSQPRMEFDSAELESLSDSIRQHGIIQPICVRQTGAFYEIISGERRLRAAKLCGMNEVPCIIMKADDEQSAVLALIENIQRRDLNYFEEAQAIEQLISVYGLTQENAASKLGKAQSTVANKLRLLRYTEEERAVLVSANISERQARSVIRVSDPKLRIKILEQVVTNNLNIEQTEVLVEKYISGNVGDENKKKETKSIFNFPVPRLYINSINKIVKRMKEAHIDCQTITNKSENYFEYTIKFPITSDMK